MPFLSFTIAMIFPAKAADKERLWESEEVFEYLIGAVCPLQGEYEAGDFQCADFCFGLYRQERRVGCNRDISGWRGLEQRGIL